MEYEKLLDKLYSEVKHIESGERFEIPKVQGRIEGKKTIIINFSQICSILRRNAQHISKFLFKELATPGVIEKERLVLNRKLPSEKINEKIGSYTGEFVICHQCGKPDTELVKQDKFLFLHCLACGAKHSVRSKI